jgi:hypothetical protein
MHGQQYIKKDTYIPFLLTRQPSMQRRFTDWNSWNWQIQYASCCVMLVCSFCSSYYRQFFGRSVQMYWNRSGFLGLAVSLRLDFARARRVLHLRNCQQVTLTCMLAVWNSYRQGLQGCGNYAVTWCTAIVMAMFDLTKSQYVLFPRIKRVKC